MAEHEVATTGEAGDDSARPQIRGAIDLYLLNRMDALMAEMKAQHREVLDRFERMDEKFTQALTEQRRELDAKIEALNGRLYLLLVPVMVAILGLLVKLLIPAA